MDTRTLARPGKRGLGVLAAMSLVAFACGDDSSEGNADATGSDHEHSEHEHVEHEHSPGEDGDAGDAQEVAREERCDIGFNTAAFNQAAEPAVPTPHHDGGEHAVDFTLEEWAEVYVQPDNPMTDGTTPEEAVAFIRQQEGLEEEVLSGGIGHSLEPDSWLPMTDPDECQQLAEELQRTREVAARYPTAQDAIDGGYRLVAPYLPAISAHYLNPAYLTEFDFDNPAMLLYDGNSPEAAIVGISHYQIREGEDPPEEGFTGPNDYWHQHFGLCMSDDTFTIIGGTNLTDEECAARGGFKNSGEDQWMSHAWVVPGCESDFGLFSASNPAIAWWPQRPDPFDLRNFQEPGPTGCGSGLNHDDQLDLDEGGRGPSL